MLGDLGPAYRVTGKLAEISDVHTLPGADRLLQKCRLPALLLGLTQEHRLPYQETGRSSVLPARKELEHPWGSESRECGTMPTGLAGCLMDTGAPSSPADTATAGGEMPRPVPTHPAQALGDLASTPPQILTAWAFLAAPGVGLGELFWVWKESCGGRARRQ